MNLYKKIMISSIYTAQNNGIMSDIWKFTSNLYFCFASNIIIMVFLMIIRDEFLINLLNLLKIKIVENKSYNFIINMFLYFYLPITMINYYVFFKNDKYLKIIKNNQEAYSKKYFSIYFIFAFLLLFIHMTLTIEFKW